MRLGPTVTNHVIPVVEAQTMYSIRVEAIFEQGTRSVGDASYRFDVPRKPVAPMSTTTADSIFIEWDEPVDETGTIRRPVAGYELSWRKSGSVSNPDIVNLGSQVYSHTISDLDAGTTYEVALRAHNPLGYGEVFRAEVNTDMPAVMPSAMPTPTPTPSATPTTVPLDSLNLAFQKLATDGLTVMWNTNGIEASQVSRFELSWTPSTVGAPELPIRLPSSTRKFTISNLEGGKRYEIEIVAVYVDDSRVEESIAVIVDVPRNPDARAEVKSPTSVEVSWADPKEDSGTIRRPVAIYELSWRIESSERMPSIVELNADTRSYLVEDLISGTRYEFALRSSNALGYSKTANLSIETPQIPAMPTPGTDRTPQPTVVDRPMLTPTESSTVTEAGKTQASRRHSRDVDPDPPEDFNAVQGRDGVVIYWDNPRWDGGYDILAYAVDWYPETLQFPLFLPPTEHSARIRGLKPDINYRMRVQAFNLKDNGLPAIARIELAESLIKLRSYDPFTGSIAYNRSTTLKNAAQLPGFEIRADADTMFWGDEMVFSIERLPLDHASLNASVLVGLFVASDGFELAARVESRRQRFNTKTNVYEFPSPIKICIEPILLEGVPLTHYSIARLTTDSVDLFDSTPVDDQGILRICAPVPKVNVDESNIFVMLSSAWPTSIQAAGLQNHRQPNPWTLFALICVVLGSVMILVSVRYLNRTSPAAAGSTPDVSPATCSASTTDCSSHGAPSARTKMHRPPEAGPHRQVRRPPSYPPRCKTSSPHAPDGSGSEYASQA